MESLAESASTIAENEGVIDSAQQHYDAFNQKNHVANVAKRCSYPASNILRVDNNEKGLHLDIHRGLFSSNATASNDGRKNGCIDWYQELLARVRWHRVKYKSNRFQKDCETPCWTAFYGGRREYSPYKPVPEWFQPLVDEITFHLSKKEGHVVKFNAFLLRLYFDGNDEIAWHTDGRTFLGDRPSIASLSLGCIATFQMRRMNDVWPCADGTKSTEGCVDVSTPIQSFTLRDGDLLVMRGNTQKHWHHRVPKEKGRGVRFNINLRYIHPGLDAKRGQMTYYKYMVYGDCPMDCDPPSWTFDEIMYRRGGIMNFVQKGVKCERSFWGQSRKNEMEHSNKKFTTNNDCDAERYLACEQCVDRDVFMSLPEEIRKELISEWKSKQQQQQQQQQPNCHSTAAISSYSPMTTIDSNCKRKPTFRNDLSSFAKKKTKKKSKSTIDSFFAKKDMS